MAIDPQGKTVLITGANRGIGLAFAEAFLAAGVAKLYATARKPEPHIMLTFQAEVSFGSPAAIAAWRGGFWPWAAVRIWPIITSETSSPATSARASASRSTTSPSSWAVSGLKVPLNEPTGVRAALAITTSVIGLVPWRIGNK